MPEFIPSFRTRVAQALVTAALLAGALPGFALAATPTAFEAVFEVHRNGKLIGESTFRFEVDSETWTLSTETRGTHGLAKLLGLEESSLSTGDWVGDLPRPARFEQTVHVAVKTVETRAAFDWASGTVFSEHEDGETVLDLSPGVVDPVAAGLAVRSGLARGESEWRLTVVDEDELEEHVFRIAEEAPLDTALGCRDTQRVDRDRGPDSTRYTRTWYARDLAWVPVQVTHGKTDGDHMESRLASLVLDGEAVAPVAACP